MRKTYLLILCLAIILTALFFSNKEEQPIKTTNAPTSTVKTNESQNKENSSAGNTNDSYGLNFESEYQKEYNKLTKEEREIEDFNRKKSAIFSYSRSGNNPDTEEFLKKALDDGLLTDSEYQKELGHMLSIDVKNPSEILNKIIASGDRYGYEVVLSAIAAEPEWIDKISSKELDAITSNIESHKPEISGHVIHLGFSDVFTYQNWLRSMSSLSPNETEFYNFMSHLILNELTDPRESIAIEYTLSDFEDRHLLSEAAQEKLKYDINNYITSYPDNEVANYIIIERNQNN